ncbi:hypothetical protein ACFX16_013355 [Malus domestica]
MNADGQICTQGAVDKVGKEFAKGLEYMRSSPLASLNYNFSFSDPPTWFLSSKVNSDHLDFTLEDGAIKVGQNQGDLFQAYIMMKVKLMETPVFILAASLLLRVQLQNACHHFYI